MPTRFSHCHFCGQAYASDAWPRVCAACHNLTYRNPLPVAVILLPVDGGLLTIRRSIEPRKGSLALPGGYIDFGESWQAAAARELFEETGIRIDAAEVKEFRVASAPDSTLLVFGRASPRKSSELPPFVPSNETSEQVIISGPQELAFSLHTDVVRAFFEEKS